MPGGAKTARVTADYHQYQVAAGPDIDVRGDLLPGLLAGLGPQAVAVITGLQYGDITVTAQALPAPPERAEPGWDVAGETDLECPEGEICVSDWAGPSHDELGNLAIGGPGRYRLRVHARHRDQAEEDRSGEEHHLLIWPVTEPTPPRLLTPLDAWGRIFNGEQPPDTPPLDDLDRAAATAVRHLAELLTHPQPPELSGELTTIHAETIAPATPKRTWNQVASPWFWVGSGGGGDASGFDVYLLDEPSLTAEGTFVTEDPPSRLRLTWSWISDRRVEVEGQQPYAHRRDLITGETTFRTRTVRAYDLVPSWKLPAHPSTVDITLRRHGKGTTAVTLEHHDLPTELAATAQPFWDWALRELHNRLTKAPFHGYPWKR
jgi:hypothetical protein